MVYTLLFFLLLLFFHSLVAPHVINEHKVIMLLHEIQAKIDLEVVALLTLAAERKKEREREKKPI